MQLAQPIFVVGRIIAIEVGDLSFILGGREISSEGQAESVPTIAVSLAVTLGLTLMSHVATVVEGIGDRCIEVLFIDQYLIAFSDITSVSIVIDH